MVMAFGDDDIEPSTQSLLDTLNTIFSYIFIA